MPQSPTTMAPPSRRGWILLCEGNNSDRFWPRAHIHVPVCPVLRSRHNGCINPTMGSNKHSPRSGWCVKEGANTPHNATPRRAAPTDRWVDNLQNWIACSQQPSVPRRQGQFGKTCFVSSTTTVYRSQRAIVAVIDYTTKSQCQSHQASNKESQ